MIIRNINTGYLSKFLLSTFVLIYSTVIQFSIPSIVLCFGDDGHIAFEQTGENFQCDDEKDHPIHKHKNLSHEKNDCQDIPLLNVFCSLFLEKNGKIKTVKHAINSTTLHIKKTDLLPRIKLNNEVTIVNSPMKSLQTTILLI